MSEVALQNGPGPQDGQAFRAVLEDMRVQVFRIYESVRAAQRGGAGDVGLQMRHLRVAAWRAAELAEQIALLHNAADIDAMGHDVESVAF